MTSLRTRSLAALAVGVLGLAGASAAKAATTTVTGFSDQSMGGNNPAYAGWTANTDVYAGLLSHQNGGPVSQARYQVRWDIATLPATHADVVTFDAWLANATARQFTPLVTFQNPVGDTYRPTPATYSSAVSAFRGVARWGAVNEFTAWNEPNHSDFRVRADWAAAYYDALVRVCNGTCTVAAGDLSGDRTPGTYYADYVAGLRALGRNPNIWAYHPYEVINNGEAIDRYNGLLTFLDSIGLNKTIWFTEVGAYYCKDQSAPNPGEQQAAAGRLKTLMEATSWWQGRSASLNRVYYYHLTGSGTWSYPTGPCTFDSGLQYNAREGTEEPRPAMRTLFPQVAGHWWALRNSNTTGGHDVAFAFSGKGTPVVGDWNGDGVDTPGTYNGGHWKLRNSNSGGGADISLDYGDGTLLPAVGNWDGIGGDTVGAFKPDGGWWFLRNSNTSGSGEITIQYGGAGARPAPGDWDGDGRTTLGVFWDSGVWDLRNDNSSGPATWSFSYGTGLDRPFVGDWDGIGGDGIGIFSPYAYTWNLRDSLSGGAPTISPFYMGVEAETRVVGDWDGNGTSTPGVVR